MVVRNDMIPKMEDMALNRVECGFGKGFHPKG